MPIKTIRYFSTHCILTILLHRQVFPGSGGASFYMPSKGGSGTRVMANENIKTTKLMLSIESLVASGANVKLEISPSDLKMFAESIVERTIEAQRQELMEQIEQGEETYMNTREVKQVLKVCDGTLNLWAKRGYLVPIKVGNKNMYAKSDIRRVQTGNKCESVASYLKRKEK